MVSLRVTVELTLYPMQGQPLAQILAFIARIRSDARLEVTVNQMSTQIRGELDAVLETIGLAIRESFGAGGSQALVAKFLNADLPIAEPPDLGER